MTNDSDFRFCEMWQEGSGEPPRFTPEELRGRITRFERTIKRRNLREYLAAALVIGIFGYYTWMFPTLLLRIGCGLIIAGTAYVIYQLHRRGSTGFAPEDMGLRSCVEFQRSELVRQRDALKTVWSWYLLPFLPGMVVFLLGLFKFTMQVTEAAGRPFPIGAAIAGFGLVAGCIGIVFLVIWLMNRRAAKNLQAEIDNLDRLTRDSA
jgi:hypothetical protein